MQNITNDLSGNFQASQRYHIMRFQGLTYLTAQQPGASKTTGTSRVSGLEQVDLRKVFFYILYKPTENFINPG